MEILLSLQKLEKRLFYRVFQQTEKRMVIPMSRALSHSGDGYLHLLVPLLIWTLDPQRFAQLLPLLALSLTGERIVYWLVKNTLRRPRPQDSVPGFRSLIKASDQFSFPSGHSSGAFLLATCLMLVYGGGAAPMFLWACAVAMSRVLLGVHFPGDTLAGALMGSGIALFVANAIGLG
jgi:undecaprenyl-diphosphatase